MNTHQTLNTPISAETNTIPAQEISSHSLSFSDYNGRLFCWQDQLYRAVPKVQAGLYRELFDQGIIAALVEQDLLVDTRLTNLSLAPYEMILQHRRLPFVSYPAEWCGAMLKAAALLHLDFCLALDRDDLTTDDAHPINVLFEGCEPVFVDFGSINRLEKDVYYPWPWPPYEQFCQVFLYPLLLKASGQQRLARWCLHDFENGVMKADMDALVRRPVSTLRLAEAGVRYLQAYGQGFDHLPTVLRPIVRKTKIALGQLLTRLSGIRSSRAAFLQQVRAEISDMKLPEEKMMAQPYSCSISAVPAETVAVVCQILDELCPESVLDIGSGGSEGAYALLAAEYSEHVVAIDPDEAAISQLYYQARAQAKSVLPLVMNFASPSHGLSNRFLAPAHERLQCELVMALSVKAELMMKRGFEFVVDRLAVFSSRWLLIGFVPRSSARLETRWMEKSIDCPWYTLENFETALKAQFRSVRVLPSQALSSKVSQILLLCEK